ncbi:MULTISPECIES: hypothetical protein [Acidithiobacillus]|uniref:hypothetical protein n=1 Tax=Acidithiobacillus TaxID=119977 RepID=UPI002432B53A|nr:MULTISPECIES: hypothetical protein [Acidithiobacillus]MEB8534711.1 hypothetical protein [Acidithiobacillus ferriphilus]
MNDNSSYSSVEEPEEACKRRPEMAHNKSVREGYVAGIMDASSVAMNMSFSAQWTEITERLSDTNTQALAWRTAMAITKLKLMELAQTDTERDVAMNVASVRYD